MAALGKELKLGFILSATDKMSRVVQDAVKKSTDKLSAFERNAGKISQGMMKAGTLMMGTGAAIGAATFGIAKSTAAYGDAAMKNSQAVGMNVEDWQKLSYAAKMSNVEETALSTAMGKLNKQMIEAANGSKTAGKVFSDLGIKLKDQAGNMRTPGEIFGELSGVFEQVQDGPAKAALAMELFGNSGTKLIPLLNGGKEGLQDMGEEAERLGLILNEEAARASEKFNDDLSRVTSTMQGMSMQLGVSFMPTLNSLVVKINELVGRLSGWIKENPRLVNTITKVVLSLSGLLIVLGGTAVVIGAVAFSIGKYKTAWKGAVKVFKLSKTAINAVKNSMLLFRVQYAALVVKQKLAAAAQWLFNKSLLACPAVWIVASIVAIGAAVYLLIKHWDKVSDFFKNLWEKIKKIFSTTWEWVKSLILSYVPAELVQKHWSGISTWFTSLWNQVKGVFLSGWKAIKAVLWDYQPPVLLFRNWDKVTGWFTSLWNRVKTIFLSLWQWVKGLFLSYHPLGLLFTHWSDISTWFTSLWNRVKGVFLSGWKVIKAVLWDYQPPVLLFRNWDKVTGWFTSLWNRVKTIFLSLWQWVKGLFLSYHPLGLLFTHWSGISTWFTSLWNRVKGVFLSGWKVIKAVLWDYLPPVLLFRNWDKVTSWFTSLWDNVKNIFLFTWNYIADIFSSLNPVEWISGMWDAVGNFFAGLKNRFFDWGKDIVSGLIGGITSFAKKATDSVMNIGQNIAGKFKSILGINSPSRLFMEYGLNITEGLSSGIDKGENEVSQTSGDLALSTAKGVKQSMQVQTGNTSNVTGGFSLNYSPTVNISGPANEQIKEDFRGLLRTHKDEILNLIEREVQNQQRLSFT